MPFFYAVTSAKPVATPARTRAGDFNNGKMITLQYSLPEVMEMVNTDTHLKLFTDPDLAMQHVKQLEEISPGTIPPDLARYAIAEPYKVGAALLTGKLHGPAHVTKQSIVIKVFAFTPMLTDPEFIHQLNFPGTWSDEKFVYSISNDQKFYLCEVVFQDKSWLPRPVFPYAYEKMLYENEAPTVIVGNLLRDYYAPAGGWFLSGHWNRHHKVLARELHQTIKDHPDSTLHQLLTAREQVLAANCNKDGSFFRRLSCAIHFMVSETERAPAAAARPSLTLAH